MYDDSFSVAKHQLFDADLNVLPQIRIHIKAKNSQ